MHVLDIDTSDIPEAGEELFAKARLVIPFPPRRPPLGLMTMAHFLAWLYKLPPTQRYWYMSLQDCLTARYLKAHGCTEVMVGATAARWTFGGVEYRQDILPPMDDIGCGASALRAILWRQTIGQAQARAREWESRWIRPDDHYPPSAA